MKNKENTSLILRIITNSASPLEQIMFEQWLKESENNQKYFQEIKTLWDEYGNPYEKLEFNEANAMAAIRGKIIARKPNHRIFNMGLWGKVAASLLIIIGTVLFSFGFSFFFSALSSTTTSIWLLFIILPRCLPYLGWFLAL